MGPEVVVTGHWANPLGAAQYITSLMVCGMPAATVYLTSRQSRPQILRQDRYPVYDVNFPQDTLKRDMRLDVVNERFG